MGDTSFRRAGVGGREMSCTIFKLSTYPIYNYYRFTIDLKICKFCYTYIDFCILLLKCWSIPKVLCSQSLISIPNFPLPGMISLNSAPYLHTPAL